MSSVAFLGSQNLPDPTEKLTALPDTLDGFKGLTLRPLLLRGEEGKRTGDERGHQNDLCSERSSAATGDNNDIVTTIP